MCTVAITNLTSASVRTSYKIYCLTLNHNYRNWGVTQSLTLKYREIIIIIKGYYFLLGGNVSGRHTYKRCLGHPVALFYEDIPK